MSIDKWRTRRFILGVAVIFILPAFSAWYMFYHADHRLLSASNNGELIRPPFELSSLKLTDYQGEKALNQSHKWVILYQTHACEETCKKVVDKIFRARLVLGKEMLRTQAWLATDAKLPPTMLNKVTHAQGFDTKAFLLSSEAIKQPNEKTILLVDPSGNVMMRYLENAEPKSINNDLKQLLKLSRMG